MINPLDYFTKRTRFAWFPVRRWVHDTGHYVKREGWYWLRTVVEVKAGLLDEWTAYGHYNDERLRR